VKVGPNCSTVQILQFGAGPSFSGFDGGRMAGEQAASA
jgi:hypothetical protein